VAGAISEQPNLNVATIQTVFSYTQLYSADIQEYGSYTQKIASYTQKYISCILRFLRKLFL
jgi:hypothetical protein